ncbi:S41 family peptidase [Winogradskyella sp. R77965]|uniref:S41 family peptidase n=1 Tax=Winogradskyella sp. R77965 TaxID=3093872 RepID=UPI0037DDA2E7
MKKILFVSALFFFISTAIAQNFGSLKKIDKDLLLRDIELIYQGLDKHHTGMYWYTSKDSIDNAFSRAQKSITKDLNEIEFFNLVAPLVSLSREDHTDMRFSEDTKEFLKAKARYLPLLVVFLDEKMYVSNESKLFPKRLLGCEIVAINDKSVMTLVNEFGKLFASDGYIKKVKFSDLNGFRFSKNHFLKYGFTDEYILKIKNSDGSLEKVKLSPESIPKIQKNLVVNKANNSINEYLEYKILNDTIAYLGIHTFGNDDFKENEKNKNYKLFLENSFKNIQKLGIKNLIVDVSKNGGGSEGNENLLFSYLEDNYKKYNSVCAKSQVSILDNGIDKPIKLKTFGFFEKLFWNDKMEDGSYCRKSNVGFGLMAYKKEPKYKYNGNLFVVISPLTYSGGSEFSNMIRTNKRAIFVGEETGGGYYGNTSGYSSELILPNSKLSIEIPTLKFEMNVQDGEFGRGVIPDFKITPTIEEYLAGKNMPIEFIMSGKVIK